MREGESRRIGKTARRAMHDFSNKRKRPHGARAHTRREEQSGEIVWGCFCRRSQVSMQAAQENIVRANIMVRGHDQMRQRQLPALLQRRLRVRRLQRGELADNAIRPDGAEKVQLSRPRRGCAMVCEIDDASLCRTLDRAVRLIDEIFQSFG